MKLNSGKVPLSALATLEDIRHYLGDLDDAHVTQILSLEPTVDQVEQAALWMAGEGDRLSREGHPLEAQVAAIFDIVSQDEEEEPRLPS